ncbi:hypothetical protein BGX27_007795 [Mortierella sp. AM989]|nr:hypothetical protein BGX27_007795 [Mortierella sp. AM989]
MISKRPSCCKQHTLSFHFTILLIILSSCWTQIVSAKLACTSPTSENGIIRPETPLSLGFSGTALDSTLSNITADLVCSSTGKTALNLGSSYDSTDFSPRSPKVTITDSQVADALTSCPGNAFHVKYTTLSLLDKQVATCTGKFSIQQEKMAAIPLLPSLTLPLPPLIPSKSSEPVPITTATTIVTSKSVIPTTPPAATSTKSAAPTDTSKPPKRTSQSTVPSTIPTSKSDHSSGTGGTGGTATSTDSANVPSQTDSSSSDLQKPNTTSPSTVAIICASVGVVAAIFVILAVILVWRKRQQRRMSLDSLFMGDSSLAAASGFSAKPIYARSDPEKLPLSNGSEGGAGGMTRLQPTSPPPSMPTQPYPAATAMGQRDMAYRNDIESSDHYPSQRQPSYRLPHHHPSHDYNSHGRRHG